MAQILQAYGLPKDTAIMMLYKNMKAMVCSPDGNTNFFDIVAGILRAFIFPFTFILYTLVLYLFIICQNYILWITIDLKKKKMALH